MCWIWNKYTQKIGNYKKARSACIVIKILWIKLKYNLILNSPNLTEHVSKKTEFSGHKTQKGKIVHSVKRNWFLYFGRKKQYKSLLQPRPETKEIEWNYLSWVWAGRYSIRLYFNFIHKILIAMQALRGFL